MVLADYTQRLLDEARCDATRRALNTGKDPLLVLLEHQLFRGSRCYAEHEIRAARELLRQATPPCEACNSKDLLHHIRDGYRPHVGAVRAQTDPFESRTLDVSWIEHYRPAETQPIEDRNDGR